MRPAALRPVLIGFLTHTSEAEMDDSVSFLSFSPATPAGTGDMTAAVEDESLAPLLDKLMEGDSINGPMSTTIVKERREFSCAFLLGSPSLQDLPFSLDIYFSQERFVRDLYGNQGFPRLCTASVMGPTEIKWARAGCTYSACHLCSGFGKAVLQRISSMRNMLVFHSHTRSFSN